MMTNQEKKLLYNQLGKNIREFREKLKIKQTDFARMLEISRASVVNIEKARQHPPLHLIFDIAKVLKVRVIDIVPEIGKMEEMQSDIKISKKAKNYLSKWVINNDLGDPTTAVRKIEEFIKENKS